MKMKIRLKSDLCVHSGESYNTTVDIDCCYEKHGIPYIPAKRLKGCIREAALELVDFGLYKKSVYMEIFGREGSDASKFTIENAYVENYEEICKEIESCKNKLLTHPQRVLALYTYIRNQTSLDKGVAKDTTLRSIRVVRKGMVFVSEFNFRENISEEGKELLKDAISNVKHIGISRTRGLGRVEMKLDKRASKTEDGNKVQVCENDTAIGERNKIHYSITLESAVICKSDEGNQNRTKDYFEGGKILGLLAGALGQEQYIKLMEGEVIVSNAYIANREKRCTPTSNALFKEKDQQFDDKGEMQIINQLVECEIDKQITPVGNPYMDDEHRVKSVATEISYHHKRPENKARGKADGRDESSFYQLESISSGQVFKGYIIAGKSETKTILEVLKKMKYVRMGYGRSAEYGKVLLAIESVENLSTKETSPRQLKRFALKLNSPAIFYNENAMATADVEMLKEALKKILHTSLECQKKFLSVTTIGGFNVTWHRKKPMVTALDSGTICVFEAGEEVDISALDNIHIGERVHEGYGEIEIMELPKNAATDNTFNDKILKGSEAREMEEAETDYVLSQLEYNSVLADIRMAAQDVAKGIGAEEGDGKENGLKSAVQKLLLIIKTEQTIDKVKEEVNGIETNATRDKATCIIDKCSELMSVYREQNDLGDKEDLMCLREMLIQLKYQLREKKLESKEGKSDE